MLTTHIDIEVFVDLVRKERIKSTKLLRTFKEFLISGTNNVLYGLNKDTPNETNLLTIVLEGKGEETKSIAKSYHFSIDKTCIRSSDPYQIFFLKISNRNEQLRVANKLNYLVGFITNYNKVFNNFCNEPFFRVDNKVSENRFKDWKQVIPKLPVTDIIFSDPYLFESNDKENILTENYYKLLRTVKNSYPDLMRLLIFSSIKDINRLTEIREKSKNILGFKTKIGIVLFQNESEHDRHIFTNYNHIKIGSSLNFLFDTNGNLEVKKKSTIKVESYFNPSNYKEALLVLSFLKQQLFDLQVKGKVPKFIRNNLLNFKETTS